MEKSCPLKKKKMFKKTVLVLIHFSKIAQNFLFCCSSLFLLYSSSITDCSGMNYVSVGGGRGEDGGTGRRLLWFFPIFFKKIMFVIFLCHSKTGNFGKNGKISKTVWVGGCACAHAHIQMLGGSPSVLETNL